jgi:hypothetical protein
MVLFSQKKTKKLIFRQYKKFHLQIDKNSRQITHGFSINLIVLYLQQIFFVFASNASRERTES